MSNTFLSPQIFDLSDDLVFFLDADGVVSFANRAWEKLLHFSSSSVVGQLIGNFVASDSLPTLTALLERARQQVDPQQEESLEVTFQKFTQEEWRSKLKLRWVKEQAVFVCFAQVLPEHEYTHGSLKALASSAPGVLYEWIYRSDGTYSFGWVSPKLEEIFLVPISEMDTMHSLIHPDDFPAWQESIQAVLQPENNDWNYEGRLLYPDGTIKWWQGLSTKSKVTSDEIRFAGLLIDVTTQKELLAKTAELEAQIASTSRLAGLGEMAAGIAHEVNNPLTIIQAHASRIKDMIAKGNLDEVEKSASKIEGTSVRISQLIAGLRSLSREGSGDPLEELALSDLVEDALALFREKFKHDDIELQVEIISPDCIVECRYVQIGQVLINLLSNAHFAVTRDSRVAKTRWIRLHAECDSAFVSLRIEDSGPGVPKALHQRIFEPFFTTKEAGHGTGLGLSISKRIIADHGGLLFLDAAAPQTSFVIRLPRASA